MIDVSINHITNLIDRAFLIETLEYEGDYDEYLSLDLKKTEDAEYAIRKWLGHMGNMNINSNLKELYKEDLRYLITLREKPDMNGHLVGIDGMYLPKPFAKWTDGERRKYEDEMIRFFLVIWHVWFNEPFIPAELSQYRERYDKNFVDFPHMPELWGEAEYEPVLAK